MRNFFAMCAAILILLTMSTASAQSVRIARLPIIFQSAIPDDETCNELETKIERAVHIPLNGTLQLAEYLPPNDSAQVFNDIWSELRAQNKKANLSDAMRPLAQKLNADIIVCPVLNQYSQYVSFSFGWHETFLVSRAAAELIVYDHRTDELIDKKISQMQNDTYNLRGTASFLAKICFDRVIDDTRLRERIRAIR